MPIRNTDGKEISGAARRKLRALRDTPDAPAAKQPRAKKRATRKPTKKKNPEPAALDVEQDPVLNPFAELEPAPIEDTGRLITWGAKLHALVLHQIAQDRGAYPNRREWYRALLGGTTSLGVIRDKAVEQQKIDDALRREEQEGKRQGLVSVGGRKTPAHPRPPG